VGSKLDLVNSNKKKREVPFEEAVEFAKKLNLAGVLETSAKDAEPAGVNANAIQDCFLMAAVTCFDHSLNHNLRMAMATKSMKSTS